MTTSRKFKPITNAERADVQRYKEQTAGLTGPIHYDVSDLPDEVVFGLTTFSMWRVAEAFREFGRALSRRLQ